MAKGHRSQIKRARNESNRETRPSAKLSYARISVQKACYVLDVIRGKDVQTALGILTYNPRYASSVIKKLLESAIANAENNNGSKAGQADFPHELGLILGYPLCDVIGFIKNHGQNCLYCSYWKVYDNLSQTKRVFEVYDKVRFQMVKLVEYGKSFKELVDMYTNYRTPKYA